jgi:PhzF family phenazine biosynthesis protein
MRVFLVDAFTRAPGAGNRAGVVLATEPLDATRMQAVAAAVGVSVTAFVLPGGDGDTELRFFSSRAEIPFCGYATIAAMQLLAERGVMPAPGRTHVRCGSGRLAVEIEPTSDGIRVWMATPLPPLAPSPLHAGQLMALLGGDARMLDRALPMRRAGRTLFVPLQRRHDLWGLAPRCEALAAAGGEHDIECYYVFTRETLEAGSVAHGRFFAPALGIHEDPVTGSANGPLAVYLVENGVLTVPARARTEQGDVIGRPGRVELDVTEAGPRVGGVAVTVMEARLLQ